MRLLLLSILVLESFFLSADYVHEYGKVISIDTCPWVLEVDFAMTISIGEKLLLIQSTGGDILTSNDEFFGDYIDDGKLGNYEIITVKNVDGRRVTIQSGLLKTYDLSQSVQLVKGVYSSSDLNINSVNQIQPTAWNGIRGGVVFVYAEGNINLDSDIYAKGMGFRGANYENSSYECSWILPKSDFVYDILTGEAALKGESVVPNPIGQESGKGKWANAGGGANDHNAGGGGGAGYGRGGNGGNRLTTSPFQCPGQNPGIGGEPFFLLQESNRLVFGGGGGSGHGNNIEGTGGESGGGIIIIHCQNLIVNNTIINAAGNSVSTGAGDDGAGGAGGGGIVYLDCQSISGSLTIDVSGGSGGDNAGNTELCAGSGGGGGGGAIITSLTDLSSINVNVAGGAQGINAPCTSTGANTEAGSEGNVIYNLSLNENELVIEDLMINYNDTLFCQGEATILTPSNSVDSIFWEPSIYFDDNTIEDQIVFLSDTTQINMLAYLGGCLVSDSITIYVDVCTSNNSNNEKEEIGLIDWMHTKRNSLVFGNNVLRVQIYDVNGKLIIDSLESSIPISGAMGIYFIKATMSDGTMRSAKFKM